jgi:TPP-dependent pyruvate/acetoin dehydrogenase alpha subunit
MTIDTNEQLLRDMVRIRRIEETLAELYPSQEMRTPTHFSIGQEAVAVGVCSVHRRHAHHLAKGGDLDGMTTDFCRSDTRCVVLPGNLKAGAPLGAGIADMQASFAGPY